ncbi:peptidase A4 family-domain-containing protein [Lentinula raphanica]|nr:peptidase A4 family-domain-containing protein [Lentinula raphanica]
MKFSAFFVSIALLFAVSSARPSGLAARFSAHQGRTSRPLANATNANITSLASDNTEDLFSSNWAGGLLQSPPTGQHFTDIGGTFVVPTLEGPDGAMSAWIGIDGGPNAPQSILQIGVDCYIVSGVNYNFAWFEWFPQNAFEITNLPVSPGNTITLRIQVENNTTGIITLTNESTGLTVSGEVAAPNDDAALQGNTAEWIVEDFEQNGELVPFASFGEVVFTDAAAFTGVEEVFASVGTAVDMEQDGLFLAITTINENVVTVQYA